MICKMGEERFFARETSGLIREMGLVDIVSFILAPIVSSGIIYFAVQSAGQNPAANVPLSFLLMGLMLIPVAVTIGLLIQAAPRSGGLYVPVSRVLNPTIGFFSGWMIFVALSLIGGLISVIGAQALGSAFVVSGVWTGLGSWISGNAFLVGVLFLLITAAFELGGFGTLKWFQRVIVGAPFIILIITWIILAFTSPSEGVAVFNNAFGSGAVESLRQAAGEAGFELTPWTWAGTAGILVAVIFSYGGMPTTTFFGGEMRRGKKISLGFGLGFTLVMVVYTLTAFLTQTTFSGIVGPHAFLSMNAPEALKGVIGSVTDASLPFYIGLLLSKKMAVFFAFLLAIWAVNGIVPIRGAASRVLFSLSFDRALPSQLSEVTDRGVPKWSTGITVGLAILGAYLFSHQYFAVIGTVTSMTRVLLFFFGIAAMVMPFVRQDLFERVPASLPVYLPLASWTTALYGFQLINTITAMGLTTQIIWIIFAIVGLVIYVYQQKRNAEEGIDISDAYKEIPPA
ncbi:hypothetical protein AKJ66_03450 [candidate division MSBL1 archaeon SCGC-AAA259E22]|uniref:Amino acid permease/ SLC12A domain-containing protein n=1 Tax=candidate division MSBL1 archaeon SCGC-AAA259E22 TaxID=1698265 RepID=A0A133UF34_9EURY|nr:hypothetical protein AKJ66_03450 [candidate division MSBL1 archaeon SCGC-AAA259E22]